MIRRISPRQNLMFTSLLALIPLGAFIWVYVFMAVAVSRADASLKEIGGKIAALEEDRRRVRILEKIMEERRSDFAKINAFLVSHDRPVGLIEQVEDLAKRTHNAVALAVEGQVNNTPELGFRITVDGSEESVARYLKLFELLSYAIRVEDMVFQRLSGGEVSVLPSAGTALTRLTLVVKVKSR